MTTDYAGMDDTALEASLTAEPDATPAGDEATDETTVTTPAGEESATDGEGEQPSEQDPDGFKPEGPGDLKRALEAERARYRAEREARQQHEAELARYRQQEAEAQQRHQQEQIQATYNALVEDGREDEALAYIQQVTQQQAQTFQQQAAQQVATEKLVMSAEMAREVYPDFQDRLSVLYSEMGPEWVDAMAARQPNPAKWAYEYSRAKFKTEADIEALVEARIQQRQHDLQAKHKPPTKGHQTIAHVSSGTQAPPSDRKPVSRMTDAELEAFLNS